MLMSVNKINLYLKNYFKTKQEQINGQNLSNSPCFFTYFSHDLLLI